MEPIYDLAHLAHVELLTPKLDESVLFFAEVMGMTESERQGDSVYLRGWDDYEHHTLKLTAANNPVWAIMPFVQGVQPALERRVAALERSGLGSGWRMVTWVMAQPTDFTDPDGHKLEIYYETEWYKPPDELRPALKNQASRFPGRGANLRRIDHINLLAADVSANRLFMQEYLGCRLTEQIIFDDGSEKGAWLTSSNKTYDVAISEDWYGATRAAAPSNLCGGQPRRCVANGGCLPGARRVYRDRATQARHPADILPVPV